MPYTEVEGRRLALSNLDKVLYPATGFTKGEALHYYATIAPVLLPHLRDRAVSFLRYPDGVEGEAFFAKNVPPGAPDWVSVAEITTVSSDPLRMVVIEDLPTLVWAGNLAALELHTFQWSVAHESHADRLVFDLDPGPGRDVLDCRTVALWVRERLAADGITALPKTSGAKGLHLLAPIEVVPSATASAYARKIAVEAERALPDLAISRMAKALRRGRVFVDHSQNAAAKTTAAPYTLRAQPEPTVSAPLAWEELEAAGEAADLVVRAPELPGRLERDGDPMAPLLDRSLARALPA